MKRLLILSGLCMLTLCLSAQQAKTQRSVISMDPSQTGYWPKMPLSKYYTGLDLSDQKPGWRKHTVSLPLIDPTPFLAITAVWTADQWNPETDAVWMRFRTGNQLTFWQKMEIDIHSKKDGRRHISELTFVDTSVEKLDIAVTFQNGSVAELHQVDVHFFSPGDTPIQSGEPSETVAERTACFCPQPNFQTREEWCPNGDCPENPSPTPTTVSHLIVHHSAGTNVSSDWAGVVRSIWDFHVNINGWSDIGYNWLIDPNGVLYEGRGDNILGAHFCGTNSKTMGVCVMGDFTDIEPTTGARTMLQNLLSWKICDIDVDPEGTAFHSSSGMILHHISGHQDGCATACPGDSFYPLMPEVRMGVADHIESACESGLAAPTNLEGEVLSAQSIQLTWQDNSSTEDNFIIERSVMTNSNFEVIGTTNANVTNYTDDNLQENTAYFYQVRAANEQDTSAYSNQIGLATVFVSTREEVSMPLRVFPNPVDDWLNIHFDEGASPHYELHLFEIASARLVRSFVLEVNNQNLQQRVDLSGLPKGGYVLLVTNGKQQWKKKLIINNY